MFDLTEYAKLCRAIYEFGAIDGWTLTEKMNGDTINAAGEAASKNLGFRAGLYIHSTTQSKVIAIAGADFMDLDPSISLKCLENRMQHQAGNISKFFEYLIQKYPNELFKATGHALGGSCAIYLAIHNQCVTAYTFNSSNTYNFDGVNIKLSEAENRIHRYYVREDMTSTYPLKGGMAHGIVGEVAGGLGKGVVEVMMEGICNIIFRH